LRALLRGFSCERPASRGSLWRDARTRWIRDSFEDVTKCREDRTRREFRALCATWRPALSGLPKAGLLMLNFGERLDIVSKVENKCADRFREFRLAGTHDEAGKRVLLIVSAWPGALLRFVSSECSDNDRCPDSKGFRFPRTCNGGIACPARLETARRS
jgi:hypothetical protein